tara:strand:- start:58 stop:390 length:333 start_codon:yes stop_codon:yes gene_type:complete
LNKKFIQISNNLIQASQDKNALSFIFKTKIHAILVFSIYGTGKITFENLCEKLSRVASRSTIQAILVDGVNRKYLLKSIDQNDKRKKYFSCENIKGELDLWYKNNKAIYN